MISLDDIDEAMRRDSSTVAHADEYYQLLHAQFYSLVPKYSILRSRSIRIHVATIKSTRCNALSSISRAI